MASDDRPPSFDEFDAKLRRLRDHEQETKAPKPSAEPARMRFGDGLQVGIELLAGIIGGVLIGWALDKWLASQPLFLIVFFVLGAAAGMLNAFRRLRRLGLDGSNERDSHR